LNRIVEWKTYRRRVFIRRHRSKWITRILVSGTDITWYRYIKIRLVTNAEQTKRVGMIGYGLEITEYVNY
jgi:3,4-dihydroxy 2-butanone 4-phosphate synthase/GTP cyclohydrolase II